MKKASANISLLTLTLKTLEENPGLVPGDVAETLRTNQQKGRYGWVRVPEAEWRAATKAVQTHFEDRLHRESSKEFEVYTRRRRAGNAVGIAFGVIAFLIGLFLMRG